MNNDFKINLPHTLSKDQFLMLFGGVYEHSTWVAEKTWKNGIDQSFINKDNLIAAMQQIVNNSDKEKIKSILKAHPELGANKEKFKTLTRESKSEQSSANLDSLSQKLQSDMEKRNKIYREKFDYPFIIAVKGLNLNDIIENYNQRINNSAEVEYEISLHQVHKIAKLRIYDIE